MFLTHSYIFYGSLTISSTLFIIVREFNGLNGGPQERAELFKAIEDEVESLREIFVTICDFVDDLQESQISEASISLFLTELKKVPNALKDVLATITVLHEIMQDSSSGSSQ